MAFMFLTLLAVGCMVLTFLVGHFFLGSLLGLIGAISWFFTGMWVEIKDILRHDDLTLEYLVPVFLSGVLGPLMLLLFIDGSKIVLLKKRGGGN